MFLGQQLSGGIDVDISTVYEADMKVVNSDWEYQALASHLYSRNQQRPVEKQ